MGQYQEETINNWVWPQVGKGKPSGSMAHLSHGTASEIASGDIFAHDLRRHL